MPNYPITCSCDRCFKLTADDPWEDSEHIDSDTPLNFCPQCGQQLEDNPTYSAQREKGLPHAH